jgi:putative oxidoreductase
MKIAVTVCRTILGLGFVVFGLNILHPFLPQPPLPEGSLTMQFMTVMGPTHWMSVVGFFQVLGGALVLFGGTAPLGLAILAPLLVNILSFHLLLQNGSGIVPGLVFSALEVFLIHSYWSHFRSVCTFRARPRC